MELEELAKLGIPVGQTIGVRRDEWGRQFSGKLIYVDKFVPKEIANKMAKYKHGTESSFHDFWGIDQPTRFYPSLINEETLNNYWVYWSENQD